MYVVESKGGAIICMLLSLFFLGTWPAVIASLERRGRPSQHTYLDYTMTNLLAAVIIALTFGQLGDRKPGMPNFLTQLYQVPDESSWNDRNAGNAHGNQSGRISFSTSNSHVG